MQDGLDPTSGINNQFATIPDISVEAVANRVAPRQVASGVTRGIQQLGGENVYSDGGNSQIIVKDTVPRVLMGNQTSFGEGFYVSKSGIDATTNTDSAQWIFNSNQNVFKIVKTGSSNITPPASWPGGNAQTITIPHGLGIIPAFQAFVENPVFGISGYITGGLTNLPSPIYFTSVSGATALYVSQARVDITNLYIDLINLNSNTVTGGDIYTWKYKYYIYQETAT